MIGSEQLVAEARDAVHAGSGALPALPAGQVPPGVPAAEPEQTGGAERALPSGRERELGAIILAYNDVTERLKAAHERLADEVVRLREQLAEKNRELARRERLAALGEMAAGVAHEIRNPLGAIQLYATLLIRDLAERPAARDLAGKIATGVRALEGVVGDILAFARQPCPDLRELALSEVVGECVELVAPAAAARQVRITVGVEVGDLRLRADAGQLQRALVNLLFNAVEAVAPGGRVEIDGGPDPQEPGWIITVSDDGPGITPDLIGKVFNPFFTTKGSGTGLGLAIVHSIAEAHGGQVRVCNRPEGGAAFSLVLPAAVAQAAESSARKDGTWHA